MPSPQFQKLKQQLLQNPDEKEDPIPYDPNAGTLTNVGRFIANNVASDPGYMGMMPVAGAVKMFGSAAPEALEAAPGLLQKAQQFVPQTAATGLKGEAANSKSLIDNLYNLAQEKAQTGAQGAAPNMAEIQAAMQRNNRIQDRMNALNKIRNR